MLLPVIVFHEYGPSHFGHVGGGDDSTGFTASSYSQCMHLYVPVGPGLTNWRSSLFSDVRAVLPATFISKLAFSLAAEELEWLTAPGGGRKSRCAG
jgi:hypothetical protein